jgi:hypothetical protein
MIVQAFKLVAALLGLFAIVPLFTRLATGSWRRTWEATKGYAVVIAILFVIPMAIGELVVLLFTD